ncbi:TetR/AcrR family transcriptional regulator [Methanocella sp. MCL-LM]|uniref:TetR/AcrR family transcriptional regulator n=1 Tax=Methanocella sp. MCL-LM TaxID=3412035 RepID=UPI003C7520F1
MSIADRKEREKERRRTEIIDVAEKLFIQKGFDGVSVEDVAREAELASGTLYLYFRNKEALYYAVVLRGARIMNDMFRDAVSKGDSGAEKLLSVGRAFYAFSQQYPEYYKMFLYAQTPRFSVRDEHVEAVEAIGRENFGIMCSCILEGASDGSLRPDIDPVMTTWFLMLSTQSVVNHTPSVCTTMEGQGISHPDFVEYSLDLMLKSLILPRPGGKNHEDTNYLRICTSRQYQKGSRQHGRPSQGRS